MASQGYGRDLPHTTLSKSPVIEERRVGEGVDLLKIITAGHDGKKWTSLRVGGGGEALAKK